jgi:CheY-like chemotaxis protein
MPSIAIIDNQPELAKLYQDTLAIKGHTVAFVVSSCAEAYEKLKTTEKKPDMIVVSFDHKSEALKKIKSEYPDIIVKEVRAGKQK